ncbi:hypothetical protein P5G50_05695 [Leifsonia sp. F6_8S_P_1B]|uniref:Uncharacterized protein n=1 Tax=Leifsonia williamsii TaxID=3035919 RepID=A0ABT8K910_9MICO|nr:hypothetical protein [Leifsonia williamsii]MDN4613943.1 hypothetical protein [Leifsonia williamsii]
MGDRMERARARRRVASGIVLGLLALVGTVAITIAIPTQGENPRAWGTVGCGIVTVWLCARLAQRNRLLLRHYRGEDLPEPPREAHPYEAAAERRRGVHLHLHVHRVHGTHTAAVASGVRAKDAR